MAYLPHVDDPSVFCDSTAFSDLNSSALLSPSMSEGKAVVGKSSAAPKAPTPGPIFPVLPPAHNFSVLGNPKRFQSYIRTEIPLAFDGNAGSGPMPPPPPPLTEKLQCNVNSVFLNPLIQKPAESLSGTMQWIERDVFPDSKLPVQFSSTKVQSNPKLWNAHSTVIPRPPKDMSEENLRTWLNNIANNLAVTHGIANTVSGRADRSFDSRTATKGPSGGYSKLRKPDISVINRADTLDSTKSKEEQLHWRKIYAFVEVTSNNSSPLSNVLSQISQKAACVFDVQPQREFVCAVGIIGNPSKLEFIFVIVDRAGMTHTPCTEIKSYAALTFLRIIFALCYAKPDTLGWDMSMKVNPETNEVTSIDITSYEYNSTTLTTCTFDVVKLLHSSPILYSRGTRVWIVKDKQGIFYVLKDSWILEASGVSEIQFVRHVEETINNELDGYLFKYTCPSYRIGQECVCSTDTIRGLLAGKPPTRHQRRIVTATIGDPITSFRSKKEFVAMYLDIVNALDFLNTKAMVIHGDLSINNILINRVWNHGPDDSPSRLRSLAFADANTSPNVSSSNDQNNSTSQSAMMSNEALVVQNSAPPAVDDMIGHEGTLEPIEAAGMLIDCDFMQYLHQDTHQTSGTLPFMAIEALKPTDNHQFRHHAGHDLESLLNTMLTICLYTIGPGGKLRVAAAGDDEIKLNEWFTTSRRMVLAATKSITLEAFNTLITPHLPKYWEDFAPFLRELINATWDKKPFLESPNIAKHQAYRDILKRALAKYTLEEKEPLAPYATLPKGKRPIEDSQPLRFSKRLRQSTAEVVVQPRRRDAHFLESYIESGVVPMIVHEACEVDEQAQLDD
ncbi:hypothetical protein BDZ97DRAFT_1753385 [Flammula alnicola]|nr:hypothetical protein BDZ97DRAFT_1753385 [Flammula alnicola]